MKGNGTLWADAMAGVEFENEGTLKKTGAGGIMQDATVFDGVYLDSTREIYVKTGIVRLQGGGAISNSVVLDQGSARLELAGASVWLLTGLVVSGPGMLAFGSNMGGVATTLVAGAVSATNVELLSGNLIGDGTLTVTQGMAWTGGTMSGAGATTINAGAPLNMIDAGPTLYLDGRSLNLAGDSTLARTLQVSHGAVITNSGTFTLKGDAATISQGAGQMPRFSNSGTLVKGQSLFANVATFAIELQNTGTVRVETGVLLLGAFFAQTAGTVEVQGAGDGELQGTTMTFLGGELRGSGVLRVLSLGVLQWQTATMNGTGTVIVAQGGTLNIDGDFNDNGFTITNYQTINWISGNIGLQIGSVINNQPGAHFEARSNATMGSLLGGATFNNYGTFRKVQVPGLAVGPTEFSGVAFNSISQGWHRSIIDAQFGVIQLGGGGTFSADLNAAMGAEVQMGRFNTTVYTAHSGTTFNGAGVIRITSSSTLSLAPGAAVTNHGTFSIGGDSAAAPVVNFRGNITGQGVFENLGTADWREGDIRDLLEFHNQGTLNIRSMDIFRPVELDSSRLTNDGTITWPGFDIIMRSQANPNRKSEIVNRGNFDIQRNSTIHNDAANPGFRFVNEATGTVAKSAGALDTRIDIPFITSGTVYLLGRIIVFGVGVVQNGGNVDLGNGVLTAPSYTLNAGSLHLGQGGAGHLDVAFQGLSIAQFAQFGGIGTVTGNVVNEGWVDIGMADAALGLLTITGDFTQNSTGTLRLRVKQAVGQQYDRLSIGGTARLSGTLSVLSVDGLNVQVGDEFVVLAYTQVIGDFDQPYQLPGLPAPRTWAATAPGATTLVLTVQ